MHLPFSGQSPGRLPGALTPPAPRDDGFRPERPQAGPQLDTCGSAAQMPTNREDPQVVAPDAVVHYQLLFPSRLPI